MKGGNLAKTTTKRTTKATTTTTLSFLFLILELLT